MKLSNNLRQIVSGSRTKAKLAEVFGADLRSLAALRVVLALLVLASLAVRSTNLTAHYSDNGVLPRADLLQNANFFSPYSFSLNLLNGTVAFQAFLFCLAALAAVSMLVGYRTRLSTSIVWILVLSIQFRNTLTLNAGDHLLHLLVFWGIFLPLGAVWSVDRLRAGTSLSPPWLSRWFFSIGTAALFLQIAFLYWFTAILKTGNEWRDGTALYYTLSNDQLTTQLGSYLLGFPALLTALTFATIALEALGPFLFFSPIFNTLARMAAILSFGGLHAGIWLTMEVGIFPFISAGCMVCFLPAWFWDKALPGLRAALPGRSGLPDLARRGSRYGKRLLEYPRGALARLSRGYLKPLWGWLSSPAGMKNVPVYGLAGRNGLVAGSGAAARETPAPPADAGTPEDERRGGRDAGAAGMVRLRSSLATNLLALFFILYVFSWNVGTVSSFSIPSPAYQIGPFLGLSQSWGMFAPSPPKEDGWWVIPGELDNGRQTDLLSAVRGDYSLEEVSYEKPQDIAGSVDNEPWHKYLEFLTVTEYENSWRNQDQQREQRENFGDYLCRSWNSRHADGKSLQSLEMIYVKETTLPEGQTPSTERVVLDEHSCG